MTARKVCRTSLCLLICLCVQITAGTFVELCGFQDDDDVPGKVFLRVYKNDHDNLTFAQTTVRKPEAIATNIDTNKPTVIYIHGFTENADAGNTRQIIKAYLARGDVNVIAVDWSRISSQDLNYPNVVSQMPAVGRSMATAVDRLSKWINPRTLHLVGYSLGAHVAGFVGKFTKVTIGRITGLEPALPLFYPGPCHIRPTDAEAVVILHTGSQIFGTYESTGSIDLFANPDIRDQPGCSTAILPALCSHGRSIQYFRESIKNPKAFPAYKCERTEYRPEDEAIVYMGDAIPKNIRGDYCFATNSNSPFSL